jgi:hypothetical protein
MKEKLATFAMLIQLAKLVIEMRKAQIAYFKNRLQGDLIRSKQLERSVDTLLDGLILPTETPHPKQAPLAGIE